LDSSDGLWKRICSIVSAGPSDLFLGADYKCAYLLTYLLIHTCQAVKNEKKW